jgi:hypothetical protein
MKSSTLGYFAACASIVLLGAGAFAAPQASGYHLLKKVTFGAAPGPDEYFDYVNFDPIMRRAYSLCSMPTKAPRWARFPDSSATTG